VQIEAKIHGGLERWISRYPPNQEEPAYADIRRVTVVEYPRVLVRLMTCVNPFRYTLGYAHVGKKLTKLRPSNCEQHINMKSGTFGSLMAIKNPSNILEGIQ